MSQHHRPGWIGSTVVIMASGPSITQEQCELVRDRAIDRVKAIAVSDVYRLAPWADAVFSADLQWWKLHHGAVLHWAVAAERWTGDSVAAARFGLHRVRMANRPGLGLDVIHTGGNSGYMAINLAWLWGAKRILLLGFDMQATGGRRHFFGDHPKQLVQVQLFEEWLHRFEQLAKDLRERGTDVVNCTPGSALTVFPQCRIEEELRAR